MPQITTISIQRASKASILSSNYGDRDSSPSTPSIAASYSDAKGKLASYMDQHRDKDPTLANIDWAEKHVPGLLAEYRESLAAFEEEKAAIMDHIPAQVVKLWIEEEKQRFKVSLANLTSEEEKWDTKVEDMKALVEDPRVHASVQDREAFMYKQRNQWC